MSFDFELADKAASGPQRIVLRPGGPTPALSTTAPINVRPQRAEVILTSSTEDVYSTLV